MSPAWSPSPTGPADAPAPGWCPLPSNAVAEDLGIPVLQPDRPVGDVFLQGLRRLGAEIGVVAAYGHILRPEVLSLPRHGMLNVHASLLPRLRGAAPVQWAILNGDTETGVSIMQMEAGLDSGPVLHAVRPPIAPEETGGELLSRLATLGAAALVETLQTLEAGQACTPATGRMPSPASHRRSDRETCRHPMERGAGDCVRRIRAFDPEPGAWTALGETEVKLFGARRQDAVPPGRWPPVLVLRAGERIPSRSAMAPCSCARCSPPASAAWPPRTGSRGRGIKEGDRFT